MFRTLFVTLACAIGLGLGATASAQLEFPPTLRTQKQIKEFIQFLNIHIREPSRDAVLKEQTLINDLRADPEYMSLAQARPELTSVRIRIGSVNRKPVFGPNRAWRSYASQMAGFTPNGALDQWIRKSPQSFFSGWARWLTNGEREVLSEIDLEKRWLKLKKILKKKPDDSIRAFRARDYGLTHENWTLDDFDEVVARLKEVEMSAIFEVESRRGAEGASPEPWFISENGVEDASMRALKKRARDLFLTEQGFQTVFTESRFLDLLEVPPYLAVHRGCVGGDCSTSHSWSFPYSPSEMVWFITDKRGEKLGYISGARVVVEGKTALYIRDVTGPNLSPEDVAPILDGLYRARALYGASSVVIMNDNIISNNGHEELREALHDYPARSRNERHVAIEFQDLAIRSRFLNHRVLSASYDDPSRQDVGFLVTPSRSALEKVRVEKLPPIDYLDLDSNEFSWALLQYALQSDDLDVLSRSERWTPAHIRRFRVLYENRAGRPVLEHRSELLSFLSGVVGFDPSTFADARLDLLLYRGTLRSKDAFSAEHADKTVHQLQKRFWSSALEPDVFVQFINRYPDLFNRHPRFLQSVSRAFNRYVDTEDREERGELANKLSALAGSRLNFKDVKVDKPENVLRGGIKTSDYGLFVLMLEKIVESGRLQDPELVSEALIQLTTYAESPRSLRPRIVELLKHWPESYEFNTALINIGAGLEPQDFFKEVRIVVAGQFLKRVEKTKDRQNSIELWIEALERSRKSPAAASYLESCESYLLKK